MLSVALRAVHDHGRRQGGRLRRPRRDVQQDGQPARASTSPPARCPSTSPASPPSPARSCCRSSARSSTGRRARSGTWAAYAWAGSFFCALLFFMQGESWQLGAVAIVLASILGGCSLVSYYAILVDISTEDERDHVSSRGWAFGYLGGGLLLALNLVGLPRARHVRARRGDGRPALAAVGGRVVGRLHDHPDGAAAQLRRRRTWWPPRARLFQRSFGQLFTTLKEMRGVPDDADLPDRLPVLQRRHPDGDLRRVDLRLQAAEVRPERADRHHPADPVRGLRRRAVLRPARGALRRLPLDPVGHLRLDGHRGPRAVPAREERRRCSCRRRSPSASCSAAPRRCPGRSSAC